MTTIVGIDPGIKGGITCITNGKVVKSIPMPIERTERGARVDVVRLREFLTKYNPNQVVIEEPQVRPGENIKNHLTIGINFGIIYGIVTDMGYKMEIIPATTWTHVIHSLIKGTKEWEMGSSKEKSLKVFNKLYPENATNHDGIIDAVLIAFYCLWRDGWIAKYKKP